MHCLARCSSKVQRCSLHECGGRATVARSRIICELVVTRPRIPREVRKLLETELDSIEKVDAVRYLRRVRGSITRTELMRALQLERGATHALIAELARVGLVEIDEPGGAIRLGGHVGGGAWDELMQLHDEDRLVIVSALSALAVERIRTMAARAFGEALVSKKKASKGESDS